MITKQLFKAAVLFALVIVIFGCTKSNPSTVNESCKTCHAYIGTEEVATQAACNASAESAFAAAHPGAEISCN